MPLAGLGGGVDTQPALNIIYIMRNTVSAVVGFVSSSWQWLLSVFSILVLGFGLIVELSLEIFRLLPRSIHVAERSILDRSDVLGPVLSLRFCRFQRFMKPGIKMLS